MARISAHLLTLFTLITAPAAASDYRIESDVVGRIDTLRPAGPLRISTVARSHGLGQDEFKAANRLTGKDAVPPGEELVLPTQHVLPAGLRPREIMVNLSELRLYYLRENAAGEATLTTLPIAAGKARTPTPTGSYRVIDKIKNPTWNVPASILSENPSLPASIPPGPKNPLGSRALRLTDRGLMIHGTIEPASIGTRASHGCIRMYPEHIRELFDMVPGGTRVTIVRQPVKAGFDAAGALVVEVHRDPQWNGGDLYSHALKVVAAAGGGAVDEDRVRELVERADGIPAVASRLPLELPPLLLVQEAR